jgi:hypothetical protein
MLEETNFFHSYDAGEALTLSCCYSDRRKDEPLSSFSRMRGGITTGMRKERRTKESNNKDKVKSSLCVTTSNKELLHEGVWGE